MIHLRLKSTDSEQDLGVELASTHIRHDIGSRSCFLEECSIGRIQGRASEGAEKPSRSILTVSVPCLVNVDKRKSSVKKQKNQEGVLLPTQQSILIGRLLID